MERIAIAESNTLMGVLYLYNNLHLVHHGAPTLPRYRIPARRAQRAEMLATKKQLLLPRLARDRAAFPVHLRVRAGASKR
jgi:fatty acid desaturase